MNRANRVRCTCRHEPRARILLYCNNIRHTDAEAKHRIIKFLEEHRDKAIAIRSDVQLQTAIETGLSYFIEDEIQNIQSTSLMYAYEDDKTDYAYYEIGTVLVSEGSRGDRLQEYLNALQVVQSVLELDFSENVQIFAVAEPGTASHHVLSAKLAFGISTPTEPLSALREAYGLPFSPHKDMLEVTEKTYQASQLFLKNCHTEMNNFRSSKKHRRIRLNARWFEPQHIGVPANHRNQWGP